jgi:hypothetical protein
MFCAEAGVDTIDAANTIVPTSAPNDANRLFLRTGM